MRNTLENISEGKKSIGSDKQIAQKRQTGSIYFLQTAFGSN